MIFIFYLFQRVRREFDQRFLELTAMTKLYGRMPFEASPPGSVMPAPLAASPTQAEMVAIHESPAKETEEKVQNVPQLTVEDKTS